MRCIRDLRKGGALRSLGIRFGHRLSREAEREDEVGKHSLVSNADSPVQFIHTSHIFPLKASLTNFVVECSRYRKYHFLLRKIT